jgi:hypothetical protein
MKARSLFHVVIASLLVLSTVSGRAENLGELLEQVGLGAIVGTWVDEDTQGENATVTYAWRIQNHALALSVKSQNGQSEALIGIDPASKEVLHVGIDEQGRLTKGKWSERDGLAVLDLVRIDGNGEELKLQLTHKIIDNKQLVIGMKNVATDEGGEFTLVRKPE